MPLPMVHFGVARQVLHALKNIDPSQYYLGAISPDAIHKRENSTSRDKAISHLWNADAKIPIDNQFWNDQVINYLRDKTTQKDPFIVGYCIHILTDIYWRKTIEEDQRLKYQDDPAPIQDGRMAYYNDTDQLDFVLYKTCSWRPEVWDFLQRSIPQSLSELVSADEVDAWKHRTLHWYDSGKSEHNNPIRYIQIEDIENFIVDAGKVITESLLSDVF